MHGQAAIDAFETQPIPASTDGHRQYWLELAGIHVCQSCAHFHPHDDVLGETGAGQCRRYPPRVGTVAGKITSTFPEIGAGEFCGEWAQHYPASFKC